MSRFKFTYGPWNVNKSVKTFDPGIRPTVDIEEKMKKLQEINLSGMQSHAAAAPDMNNMTER